MLTPGEAAEDDAAAVAGVLAAAAERLTREHGRGRWSLVVSEKSVQRTMSTSRVLVLRERGHLVATLRLTARKPWSIPVKPFTPALHPIYLVDMAVAPGLQRRNAGRTLLAHAESVARAWPADAIRLDAYDAAAGAGPFYARCGFNRVGNGTYRGIALVYYERLL